MPAPSPATPTSASPLPLSALYASLPERFFARQHPLPAESPALIRFNRTLAEELGIDVAALSPERLVAIFSGSDVPEGASPVAMAYAGHQFGGFSPQLGDGRAILLGELRHRDGCMREVHLKGSGRTPFSRGGDGRAALGPVLREYILSEAMHALGIPTTRALAAVTTGEPVFRETPLPGAVLTRIARSHVRVGTFQFFATRQDTEALSLLTDHVIERLYPEAAGDAVPALALLKAVSGRQASLVARWMGLGFIHGVMNTDNMAISGETIDYGPCAFMDAYHPQQVFSAIDRGGRYAYANQPGIAQWNLARLAEALLPLIDPDQEQALDLARPVIAAFAAEYDAAWLAVMRAKLGLSDAGDDDEDRALAEDLLDRMAAGEADFTLTFRSLCDLADGSGPGPAPLFGTQAGFTMWEDRWRARLAQETPGATARSAAMRHANPWIIPRNHRVEHAIAAAVEHADFAPFHRLVDALAHPWTEGEADAALALPPGPQEIVTRTFCGT